MWIDLVLATLYAFSLLSFLNQKVNYYILKNKNKIEKAIFKYISWIYLFQFLEVE